MRPSFWRSLFMAAGFAALMTSSALAFDRPFPSIAKRGEMTPAAHPQIVINGKQRVLSPGARIWNSDNLIEMPASLRDGRYVVNYTEDDGGAIDRVWMLTRDEARQPPPNKK
jgi:hypothetical protein